MKNTKKKVLVGALVVSLAALVSVGSIAWFSASDTVQNKFMVATSDDDTDNPDFDVDVWEKTPDDESDPDGTEYPDVMPGDTLTKEVHVENTGKFDEYVRMVVKVSDATAWATLLNKTTPTQIALGNLVEGLNVTDFENGRYTPVYDEDTDTLTYVYYAKEKLAPDADLTLFNAVVIPGTMTQEQADLFTTKTGDDQGSFIIDVRAQAVQVENLGDDPKAAFTTVGMSIDD